MGTGLWFRSKQRQSVKMAATLRHTGTSRAELVPLAMQNKEPRLCVCVSVWVTFVLLTTCICLNICCSREPCCSLTRLNLDRLDYYSLLAFVMLIVMKRKCVINSRIFVHNSTRPSSRWQNVLILKFCILF